MRPSLPPRNRPATAAAGPSRERKRPVTQPRAGAWGSDPRRAFTLVEMVVVVSIVLIILTLVLPAATAMWAQRKQSDAINTIQGLLKTTRAAALQSDGRDRGFFSFIDDQGVQRLISIEQAAPPDPTNFIQEVAWQNVFRVTDDRSVSLPAPLRAVPRYVVDDPTVPSVAPQRVFSESELANNDFVNPMGTFDQAQRHRNFFTMIFAPGGELLVNRDVLIQDSNADEDQDMLQYGEPRGDRTGLRVAPAATPATQYYTGNKNDTDPIPDPKDDRPSLVVDDRNVALNFGSVDGPMIYDDAAFNQIPGEMDKRKYLIESAQPLYVSRWTGTVILGPVGENETPTP